MALIIEHGGGGTSEQAMTEALGGFAQGYQQGQVMKAEEARRKAKEARDAALHEAKLKAQQQAHRAGEIALEHAPEAARLDIEEQRRQGAMGEIAMENAGELATLDLELKKRQNEKVEEELENAKRANAIGEATELESIRAIEYEAERSRLEMQAANLSLEQLETNLENNKHVDELARASISTQIQALAQMPGAREILTPERLKALAELSTQPGAADELQKQMDDTQEAIAAAGLRRQHRAATNYIGELQNRRALLDSSTDPDAQANADLFPDEDQLTAWATLLETGGNPAAVIAQIEEEMTSKLTLKVRQKRFDDATTNLTAALSDVRAEALKEGAQLRSGQKQSLEQAEEMIFKMLQSGPSKYTKGAEELIWDKIYPDRAAQNKTAYQGGYNAAMQKSMVFHEEELAKVRKEMRALQAKLEQYEQGPPGGPKKPTGSANAGGGSAASSKPIRLPIPRLNPLEGRLKERRDKLGKVTPGGRMPGEGYTPGAETSGSLSSKPAIMTSDNSAPHWRALQELPEDSSPEKVRETVEAAIHEYVKGLGATGVKTHPDKLVEQIQGRLRGAGWVIGKKAVFQMVEVILGAEPDLTPPHLP